MVPASFCERCRDKESHPHLNPPLHRRASPIKGFDYAHPKGGGREQAGARFQVSAIRDREENFGKFSRGGKVGDGQEL